MRLSEIVHSPKNTPESNLVTALELIRNRYKEKDAAPKISTDSLINLVLNTDKTFDFQALKDASENNPTVKNLIKDVTPDYVELYAAGEETSELDSMPPMDDVPPPAAPPEPIVAQPTDMPAPDLGFDNDTVENPVDVVDDMAKRAAKQRGAPIPQ